MAAMSNAAPAIPSPRVLVVDDDPKIQAVLRRGLGLEGFRVELAGDGREALGQLQRGEFDLVVLDVLLPGVDGIERGPSLIARKGTRPTGAADLNSFGQARAPKATAL